MKHTCRTDMKGFDRLLALPADHPERLEVDRCPRCSAALLAYDSFLQAPDIDGARPDAAESQMRAFVESHVTGSVGGASQPWRKRLQRLFRLSVLAPAAAVVVVVLVAVGMWRSREPVEPVLRDIGPATNIATHTPRPTSDGFRLEWEAVPGADAYEVRLLRPDLSEAQRLGPIGTTAIDVSREALDAAGPVRFWQVVALEGGDELLRSAVEALESAPRSE